MLSSAAFVMDWQGWEKGTFHSQDVFILHLHAAVVWLRSTSPDWLSLADNCRDGVYLKSFNSSVVNSVQMASALFTVPRLGPRNHQRDTVLRCAALCCVCRGVCACEIVFNLHKLLRCNAARVRVCAHCGWRSIAACLSAVSVSPCWQVYLKSRCCESPPNTLTAAFKPQRENNNPLFSVGLPVYLHLHTQHHFTVSTQLHPSSVFPLCSGHTPWSQGGNGTGYKS